MCLAALPRDAGPALAGEMGLHGVVAGSLEVRIACPCARMFA